MKKPQEGEWRKPDWTVITPVFADLEHIRGFLIWRMIHGTKMPVDPSTGIASKKPSNKARDRGTMTFAEAQRAINALERIGKPAGIGIFPPHFPDLVALDLDDCVTWSGDSFTLAEWTQPFLSREVYYEFSPSYGGLRALFKAHTLPDELLERANGHERASLGLYGPKTNKFVTITGALTGPSDLEPGEWTDEMTAAYWRRQADVAPSNMAQHFVGLYPSGRLGAEMALEDIRSGASLHPATLAYATKAANWQSLAQTREILLGAYMASEAIGTQRWHARMEHSIDAVLDWVAEQQAGDLVSDTLDDPARLVEAKGQVERLKARRASKAAQMVSEAVSTDVEGIHPTILTLFDGQVPEGYGTLLSAMLEDDPDAVVEAAHELRLEAPSPAATAMEEQLLDTVERDRVAAIVSAEVAGLQIRSKQWMVDELPVHWVRDEACRILMQQDDGVMLGGAAFTALSGVMMAAAPGWVIERTRGRLTPIDLFGAIAARTGAGKKTFQTAAWSYAQLVGVPVGRTTSWRPLARVMHEESERGPGQRAVVMIIDELWEFFAGLSGREPRSGIRELLARIMAQFGLEVGTCEGARMANQRDSVPDIPNPCLVTVGYTTPSRLCEHLNEKLFRDGAVGRMTILIDEPTGDWEPLDFMPSGMAPSPATSQLLSLIAQGGYVAVESRAAPGTVFRDAATGKLRRWIRFPEHLQAQPKAMQAELSARYAEGSAPWEVSQRSAERAIMLAGGLAVAATAERAMCEGTVDPNAFNRLVPTITPAIVTYACRFIAQTTGEFVTAYQTQISGGTRAEELRQTIAHVVLNALAAPGTVQKRYRTPFEHGRISTSFLYNKLRKWTKREVDDALAGLEAAGIFGGEELWRKPQDARLTTGRFSAVRRLLGSFSAD